MKVIQIELQNSLVQLSSTQKDEFETDAEYRARIAIRESKSTEFNNKFQNKRVSLRRDRFSNRVQLVRQYDEKLNHIFIANRKPVTNLKAYTGNYSPEAEIFPITISTEGRRSNNPEQAVTWRGTVKVPRGQAKAFKEGVDKYKISGELQSTRTGDKILVNITLTSPEGSDSYKLAWKDLPKSVGKPKIEKKAETEVAEPAEQTETEEAKPASKL